MIQSRKISGFTTAGIFVAIISLALCTSILNTSYSSSGIAVESKIIYAYELKNPSNVFLSNENMKILKKPSIKDNEINYGINLMEIGDYSQFTFELENKGNVAVKVKGIKINYPVEYQDYVTVSIDGIDENDVIQPGSTFANIKVVTKYNNGYYVDEMLKGILLDNVTIKIEFYE